MQLTFAWRPQITRGALLLMEAIWVYSLTAFLAAAVGRGGDPSFVAAALIVALPFFISRFLQQTEMELPLLRIWGGVFSLLLFYAIIRVDFFGDWRLWDFTWADDLVNHTADVFRERLHLLIAVPLLWLFWLRGILRGQQYIGFDAVVGSFAIGVVIIAPVVLLAKYTDAPQLVGVIAVPFVAIGLLAIGLAHAAQSEDEYERSFAPTWLVSVGGAVLVIAGFALVFALIDLEAATKALQHGAGLVAYGVGLGLYYITWPFIQIAVVFFKGIRWFFENIFGGEPVQQEQTTDPGALPPEPTQQPTDLPGWIETPIRILVAIPIVALVLAGLALAFSRIAKRNAGSEVKESTYREGQLLGDIGDMFGSLLGRLRPNVHLGRDHLEPARRLYFDMLDDASHRDIRRRPMQTPLELAPDLDSSYASATPSQVTSVFDDARYGGFAPPEDELQRLRREWDATKRNRQV